MIHIARHMYHLSGKSAVLRGHLKAIAALKQVFAGDHRPSLETKQPVPQSAGANASAVALCPKGSVGEGRFIRFFSVAAMALAK